MRGFEVVLCAVLLVGVVAVGTAVGATAGPGQDVAPPGELGGGDPLDRRPGSVDPTGPPEPGRIVMSFHVRSDGSALASVAYWIPLGDETSTTAFEHFRESVRDNRSDYVDRFERRMQATARNAERSTGRAMSVENVTLRVFREPQGFGVVEYSFEWHGFAATTDDHLVIGPALGGLHLGNQTRLLISWPGNYEALEIAGTVTERRDRSAVWVGPTTFDRSGPRVVLERKDEPFVRFFEGSVPLSGAAVFVLIGGVVVWGWLRRRNGSGRWTPFHAVRSGSDGGTDDPDGSRADTAGGTAGADEDASAAANELSDEATSAGPAPPPELMSNREALLTELRRRGGRAKQKEVVRALDWSDAKGSRVVSDLREEGTLESFRLGNENVLVLQDGEGRPTDLEPDARGNDDER